MQLDRSPWSHALDGPSTSAHECERKRETLVFRELDDNREVPRSTAR